MDKTLQDLAWSCLPKEFKEEVKKLAQYYSRHVSALFGMERQRADKFYREFVSLFGHHNLASDAEGEEMLTVPRKRVEKIFVGQMEVQKCTLLETIIHCEAAAKTELLYTLFGSKCLPDNVESSEPNVDSLPQNPTENCDNESHISTDCDKPAEPKFKKGDKMRYRPSGEVYEVEGKTGRQHYALKGWLTDVLESDLEPYTEPKENVNLSQPMSDCNKQFDNILKDSFRNERRLNIAAILAAGMLASEVRCYPVDRALELADALIAECERTDKPKGE